MGKKLPPDPELQQEQAELKQKNIQIQKQSLQSLKRSSGNGIGPAPISGAVTAPSAPLGTGKPGTTPGGQPISLFTKPTLGS